MTERAAELPEERASSMGGMARGREVRKTAGEEVRDGDGSLGGVWKLGWLTPFWCRVILVGLLLLQVVPRVFYLNSDEALNLSPDESQYWVWSRHLDWSYYSKGPMVALIIRASCEIFGNTMPAVRYPAMAIGVGMTVLTYWLTRRLFGSERVALGAVALNYMVPLFAAGSMIMTIDPPYVMFWSLATACFMLAVRRTEEGKGGAGWLFPLGGLFVGCSFLAKYAAFFLLAGLFLGLIWDSRFRRHLRTPWPYVAVGVALLCTLPVVYWNWVHGWASAKHVQADTTKGFNPMHPLTFIGGTAVLVGPLLCALMVGGVVTAMRWAARAGGAARVGEASGTAEPVTGDGLRARYARLLFLTVLPYLAVVTSSSFFTNAQLNWSAPVWFALLIVAAWFVSTRLRSMELWKPWRGAVWGTAVFAVIFVPFAHDVSRMYPAFAWFIREVRGKTVRTREIELAATTMPVEERRKLATVRQYDATARLRGWKDLAKDLNERRLKFCGADAFVLADDYSEAASLEFYMPGHPKSFVMGPYIEDPKLRGRQTQWAYWPERSLEKEDTPVMGKNAIYIGARYKVLEESFERVERLEPKHVITQRVGGVEYSLGTYEVYALYGFKGMKKPVDGRSSW